MKEKIEELVDKKNENECWEWRGEFNRKYSKPIFRGYKKRKIWVHRFLWELHNGKIPRSGMIWRLCWNDLCCNVKHMKLVMPGETCPESPKMKIWKEERSLESSHMNSIREEINANSNRSY